MNWNYNLLEVGIITEIKEKRYIVDDAHLMEEWDWEANNNIGLHPEKLTHGSTKKANWICKAAHRYLARIDHRTIMRSGCPFCAGKRPIVGVNDLSTTHPDLLLEWDYEQNTDSPDCFLAGSNKKVFWRCRHCSNSWSASIVDRAIHNTGCPACMRIQRGISKTKSTIAKRGSLQEEFPNLAEEWDYEKNYPLTPDKFHASAKQSVWWIGKCKHSWEAIIRNRAMGTGCPVCAGKKVLSGFNDLESRFPEIAIQWHPTLNGELLPSQITAHCEIQAWWYCSSCDDAYRASVYSRTSLGTGCPICKNRVVAVGKNDLQTTHPEIANEWNADRNGNLKPVDVVAGSNRIVWWKCRELHEWKASIVSRTSGRGCPTCAQMRRPIARQKTFLKKNGSLRDNYPEIAAQWHPTKNEGLKPEDFTSGSSCAVWWLCSKGHEWKAVIYSRVAGRGCPYCNYDHGTSFPEQALYFYLSKITQAINRYKLFGREIDIFLPLLNIGIEYNGRYYHGRRKVQDEEKRAFFREKGIRIISVQEGDESHIDGDEVHYQYINSNYPNLDQAIYCILRLCALPTVDVNIGRDRQEIFSQYLQQEKSNSLAVKYPWLIEEWDWERNGKLTPWLISYGSNKRVHWICPKCGHCWDAVAHSRKKAGCPRCANRIRKNRQLK